MNRELILAYLRKCASEGWTPSVREIGEAVGLSSTSSVQSHLNALLRDGLIARSRYHARSVRLTEGNICPHCKGSGRSFEQLEAIA